MPPLALPDARTPDDPRRWPAWTPSRCSASARGRTIPAFELERRQRRARSRRSAGASTGCRWRSSWRPPAAGCSRPREIAERLRRRARRARRGAARRARPPADAARDDRLEPRPARATTSRRASRASRCSPAARRWRRPRRSPAPTSTRSTGSSPRACSCAAGRRTDARRLGMLETIRAYAAERFAARRRPRRGPRAPLPLLPRARPAPREPTRRSSGRDRNEHLAPARRRDREPPRRARRGRSSRTRPVRPSSCPRRSAEYWLMRDRYADAVDWIDRALSMPGADGAPALRVRALCSKCLGRCGRSGAEPSRPRSWRRPRPTRRALGDPAILSQVL